MFEWLDKQAYEFEDNKFAYNAHDIGISPTKFESDKGLKEMFEVVAVSNVPGSDNKTFVAAVEGKKYPFFGTMFHPEMTSQTWRIGNGVNHTWKSI